MAISQARPEESPTPADRASAARGHPRPVGPLASNSSDRPLPVAAEPHSSGLRATRHLLSPSRRPRHPPSSALPWLVGRTCCPSLTGGRASPRMPPHTHHQSSMPAGETAKPLSSPPLAALDCPIDAHHATRADSADHPHSLHHDACYHALHHGASPLRSTAPSSNPHRRLRTVLTPLIPVIRLADGASRRHCPADRCHHATIEILPIVTTPCSPRRRAALGTPFFYRHTPLGVGVGVDDCTASRYLLGPCRASPPPSFSNTRSPTASAAGPAPPPSPRAGAAANHHYGPRHPVD